MASLASSFLWSEPWSSLWAFGKAAITATLLAALAFVVQRRRLAKPSR